MKDEVATAYNNCFDSINQWVEQAAEKKADKEKDKAGDTPLPGTDPKPQPKPTPKPKISVRKDKAMNIVWNKPVLESKEDVEQYVDALRQQLLSLINQNKNIMLN